MLAKQKKNMLMNIKIVKKPNNNKDILKLNEHSGSREAL